MGGVGELKGELGDGLKGGGGGGGDTKERLKLALTLMNLNN